MRKPASGGEAGYSMALLIIIFTVLVTMSAASLPMWSKLIQHDREEELISRGWQYAEAIRLFQNRFGRLPITLDELIKTKPRCIRHLYKDPMTDQDFAPIFFLNRPLQRIPGQPAPPPQPVPGLPSGPSGATGPNGEPVTVGGPIIGVHSKSTKKSALVFYGQETYDQWNFTVEMLTNRVNYRGISAGGSGKLELSTRWLGRPLEFGQPPATGLPSQPGMPPPTPPRKPH
jgi:hypothetical protein